PLSLGSSAGRVSLQPGRPLRVTQLGHRHLLDLADPLAAETELAAHLVERALPAVVQAEPQPDHRRLPLGQRGQHDLHLAAQLTSPDTVARPPPRIPRRDEISERALAVLADRLVQADRLPVVRDQLDDLEL